MIVTDRSLIDLSNFKPYQDYVLIERLPATGLSNTILIPDVAVERSRRGRVLRVGPGKPTTSGRRIPMQVKSGDVVQYQSADVDAGDYVLIQEGDILFIES